MRKQAVSKSFAGISSSAILFALNFFKNPTMLGSIVPSSPYLVNDLLSPVNWDRAGIVVEYGPGVGTITREILKRMRHDAILVAIELNDDFVEYLGSNIRDPRLRLVHGSAGDVRRILQGLSLTHADYIISCIPYSTIPHKLRRHIVEESRHALKAEGSMLLFQFTRTVVPYLRSTFTSVRQGFQLLNILPAQIFYCTP